MIRFLEFRFKMARGGARPGAGRPKGTRDPETIKRERAARMMRELIYADIEPIIVQLKEKALGGDIAAIRECIDRGFGKAQQFVDLTTDGQPLPTPIYGGKSE